MTKILLKNSRAATILLLLLALAGCSKKEVQAPSPATSPKVEPAKVLPMPPVQKQTSSATRATSITGAQFDFSTKKDPFKPFIAAKAAVPVAENLGKNLLPIHKFDVNQFRVIGVVTGGKENQAMVVDPNGKGYVLKTGMTIGKSEARVTAITSRGIEILEQFRDDNGRVHKQRSTITLPRKE
jgi:type IV pilus assembly protein PilP